MQFEGIVCKCHGCGAPLNLMEDSKIVECDTCGVKNVIPKMITGERQKEYEQANEYSRAGEFDLAEKMYQSLLSDFPKDAELHWQLLMCKYGVRFVEDPATHKNHPTIQRMQKVQIIADEEYRFATENASPEDAAVYMELASQINQIQARYFEIIKNESAFDIFLSYKETDEKTGGRTEESVIAAHLFDVLTDKGYKVFYAKYTLEGMLGQEYEPYIYAALSSSKVMLLIGAKTRNLNATWVKNEWSRFLKIMEEDHEKHLIPVYKGMDAYDLPESLVNFQGQNWEEIGAEENILHALDKFFNGMTVATSGENNVKAQSANLANKAKIECEGGEYQMAIQSANKALEYDAENADAYLIRLMATNCWKTLEAAGHSLRPFGEANDFKNFCKFCKDAKRIKALKELNETILAQKSAYEEEQRRKQEEMDKMTQLQNERNAQYMQALNLINQRNMKSINQAEAILKELPESAALTQTQVDAKKAKTKIIQNIVIPFVILTLVSGLLFGLATRVNSDSESVVLLAYFASIFVGFPMIIAAAGTLGRSLRRLFTSKLSALFALAGIIVFTIPIMFLSFSFAGLVNKLMGGDLNSAALIWNNLRYIIGF